MTARMLSIGMLLLSITTAARGQGIDSVFRDPLAPAPAASPIPGIPVTTNAEFARPSATSPSFAPRGEGPSSGKEPRYSLVPEDKPDINQDLLVTPQQGPWMICVTTYSGSEAPVIARELALELRNTHRTASYIFNYGAEERKKEYQRVKAIVDKQREYLIKNNLPTDYPLRVRFMRVEEQCGVLIGGFPTEEAARRTLDTVKKLPQPDPKKVKLDQKVLVVGGEETAVPKGGSTSGIGSAKPEVFSGYINPYQRAFVCRNPSIKQQEQSDGPKWDLASLRRLNTGESYSLLECKKPLTLVVKQFQTPHVVQGRETEKSVLDVIGFGKTDQVDSAAHSAHNLAELLRKAKLDSYVLHTKYASIVTVGGFDGLEDPNLRAMQNLLETRLRQQLEVVQLMTRPMPMQVPR